MGGNHHRGEDSVECGTKWQFSKKWVEGIVVGGETLEGRRAKSARVCERDARYGDVGAHGDGDVARRRARGVGGGARERERERRRFGAVTRGWTCERTGA